MKKRIKFEKYLDPWGHNLEDMEQSEESDDSEDDILDLDLDEMTAEEITTKIIKKQKGNFKAIITPVGIIPLTDFNKPSKYFNMWVGHTNFDISDVLDIIEDVDGVEMLEPITRYRFLVSIGKCFPGNHVMNQIGVALNVCVDPLDEIEDEDRKQAVKLLRDKASKSKYWAIYVFPNGVTDSIASNVPEQLFLAKFDMYNRCQEAVGGHLLSYKDDEEIS